MIEAIQIGNYYTYVAASDRRFTDKATPPKPIARPGDVKSRKRRGGQTQEQIDSVLKAWREGGLPMVEQRREVN